MAHGIAQAIADAKLQQAKERKAEAPTREELVAELEAAMEALTPMASLGAEGSKIKNSLVRLRAFMDRVYEGAR